VTSRLKSLGLHELSVKKIVEENGFSVMYGCEYFTGKKRGRNFPS